MVSSSYDRTIRMWDVASAKQLPRVPGQQHSFTDRVGTMPYFEVSPDGKKLLTFEDRQETSTVPSAFDLATDAELFAVKDPLAPELDGLQRSKPANGRPPAS